MSNRPVAFTAERLLQALQSLPAVNAYMVGFSGGADSTALLHALATLGNRMDTPVSAVHVNHGLHADADLWQLQCEKFCLQSKIELTCLKVEIGNNTGKGLEAEARELRYQAISKLLKPEDCLLTAHHADDQAETLLLNLMRGSGVDGLSAMPASRPLGDGFLQRPLLKFQNSSLKDYLRENHTGWIEDPSNQQLDHDRNFVRHKLIPLLDQRWPEVGKRLLLTTRAMSDTRKLLEKLADNYLENQLAHPFVLRVTRQTDTNPELFKLVLRRWLKQAGASSIPVYQLESLFEQVRQANSGNKVALAWHGWVLRLYKQKLWLHPDQEILPCPSINWTADSKLIDLGDDVGQLMFEGNRPSIPDGDFSVGARSNLNETVIAQGVQHKSLKNLFQKAGIPPWLRDSIPLCKLDGELVAMGDWCFDADFASWMTESNTRLRWLPRHPLLQFVLTQQHTAKP
jgi:tRNA(Ile)-lysidine synthase